MNGIFELGTGTIIILSLILSQRYKKENFTEKNYSSSNNSMPLIQTSSETGNPLFLNFYSKKGSDFKLFEYIKKLRLNHLQPTWNGLYINEIERPIYTPKNLSPIIIVPGIGATPIYAKWNKNNTISVKTLDDTGQFEKGDVWSCRQLQEKWTKIWGPQLKGLDSECWSETAKVFLNEDGKTLENSQGTDTSIPDFGTMDFLSNDYMTVLVDALESLGHTKGYNLFGASYDFRKIGCKEEITKWCNQLKNLIEVSCSDQQMPAIIIGHDLGSMIANYFLVNSNKEWKDKYIKTFITVSGTFGGTPKALRALISGSNKSETFNDTIKNFSGLYMMLPKSNIYGDNPLIHLNSVSYNSYDVPKIIKSYSEEMFNIYELTKEITSQSMKAPQVPVHIIIGDGLDTESSYNYGSSLKNKPQINYPYYQTNLPENQNFTYPDYFTGDGTMPKFALEYPIFWTKSQKENVYFQILEGSEHTDILSSYEFIKYLVTVL